MRIVLTSLLMLLAAAPAGAAPDWRQAREYEVLLSNLDIEPERMEFRAGEPLRLRLVNNSSISHSFSAADFFRAGEVRPRERKFVSGGKVELAPGETREILILPAAGEYSARCANLFHRILGMSAKIVVR